MLELLSIGGVLLAVFGASLLIERLLGRSRKQVRKPGWYIVFFLLFAPGLYFVYADVSVESPLIYAAYGAAGGFASLIAQASFGVKLAGSGASDGGNDA